MGRRGEQRIAISFPVIVRGVDTRGARFQFITKTLDVSFSGAALKGLTDVVTLGSKVEIECRTEKALYRVVWVGQIGTPNADRIGLRCLEMGKYIWGVPPKEWQPDTYDPAHPARPLPVPDTPAPAYDGPRTWSGKERRQFARHHCRIEAQVTVDGESLEMAGKITDISLGGCYVEMLSPLPVGTLIKVAFSTGEKTLRISAKVCSSQTGLGMGVAFTGMGPEDFEKLRRIAPPTADAVPVAKAAPGQSVPQRPAVPPRAAEPSVTARSYASAGDDSLDLSSTQDALAALVRLLIRKQIFTVGEMAEELEKLKIIHR